MLQCCILFLIFDLLIVNSYKDVCSVRTTMSNPILRVRKPSVNTEDVELLKSMTTKYSSRETEIGGLVDSVELEKPILENPIIEVHDSTSLSPLSFDEESLLKDGDEHQKHVQQAKDDGKISGNIVNGLVEGSGKKVWLDGTVYEGNFVHSLRDGFGTVTFPDGTTYIGEWKDDAYNGQGLLTHSRGLILKGQFVNGTIFNGEGAMVMAASKRIAEGVWTNGFRNGPGKDINSNGHSYVGDYFHGMRHGNGTLRTSDGSIYEGWWMRDKPNGHGRRTSSTGQVWEGEYRSGRTYTGTGTVCLSNLTMTGTWVNGQQQGIARNCYPKGVVYEGKVVAGKQHGYGVLTFTNGQRYEGYFRNNLKHGQGKMTWSTGEVWEGLWVDNKPWMGSGVQISKNGRVIKGEWSNGWVGSHAHSDSTVEKENTDICSVGNSENM